MKKVLLSGIATIFMLASSVIAQESSDKPMNANWGGFDFGFASMNTSNEWNNKLLQSV